MAKLVSWLVVLVTACISSITAVAAPASVEMTWMSIANWYFQIGDKRIMMDAYITRVPGPPFFVAPAAYPNDLYAYTQGPYGVDLPSITRVRDAVLGSAKLDYLLAGHSHFDHTWDTPTWAKLTGAPMIGGMSSCFQALAQGVPTSQCRSVSGGEKIALGDGITARVVRFNHSGDASNPVQHFARELYRPPILDPATGGLRAGVGEDYPNGGGNRAFLFTVDTTDGQVTFFVQNSASAFDLEKDILVDGVSYGAPLKNLAAAMADAGLKQVDVWIGTGGRAVAELIVPVLHPKVYIPSHWDGLFNSFWKGMPYPFKDDDLTAYLGAQNVVVLPQKQYFDTYVLTRKGVTMVTNHDVKQALGFRDVQGFDKAMLDAVSHVASTSDGDDCGEGFKAVSAWSAHLAQNRYPQPAWLSKP
jgi:hypothetical protein